MRIWVGIDIAKEDHWATAIGEADETLIDERLPNEPESLERLIHRLEALGGEVTVGLDIVGGIASLSQAMLASAGFALVHVPGLAVNRARQGTTGGESKSDPRDARVIAEQVRRRTDLRPITGEDGVTIDIRLLVGRRRDLVDEQTRRLARLRDLLTSIHPGLERVLDVTNKGPLWLLTRYVRPDEIRRVGQARLVGHLRRQGGLRGIEALADAALQAAHAQRIAVPGEALAAELVRELAREALAARDRIERLDADLAELLARHPDAALIRSLPGMGAVLTAEFIAEAGTIARFRSADALAAAAGLAPVLRQSGKVRFLRRPSGGNKGLKRVFYQSAFCSLGAPSSRAFYGRKRREGKRHHQALIALARRRIDVLWAILETRTPFSEDHRKAA
ncbi:MAG TPA: IS110 family transposase [Solirubrobacterales bacterium]|jgi:transposase|nr:IS110 family transposase [Solirubrobacterales bacterium]